MFVYLIEMPTCYSCKCSRGPCTVCPCVRVGDRQLVGFGRGFGGGINKTTVLQEGAAKRSGPLPKKTSATLFFDVCRRMGGKFFWVRTSPNSDRDKRKSHGKGAKKHCTQEICPGRWAGADFLRGIPS